MSTITATKSRKPSSDPCWIPSSLYRLTLEQYEAMVDAGIDRQVEVYSNPGPSGYQSLEVFVPPHVVTVMIDGVDVGEIPVAEILP